MRLNINGAERNISSSNTIAELVRELDIHTPHFAMALNFQVVPKSQYESTPIKEGDHVEIVHAVGGG